MQGVHGERFSFSNFPRARDTSDGMRFVLLLLTVLRISVLCSSVDDDASWSIGLLYDTAALSNLDGGAGDFEPQVLMKYGLFSVD